MQGPGLTIGQYAAEARRQRTDVPEKGRRPDQDGGSWRCKGRRRNPPIGLGVGQIKPAFRQHQHWHDMPSENAHRGQCASQIAACHHAHLWIAFHAILCARSHRHGSHGNRSLRLKRCRRDSKGTGHKNGCEQKDKAAGEAGHPVTVVEAGWSGQSRNGAGLHLFVRRLHHIGLSSEEVDRAKSSRLHLGCLSGRCTGSVGFNHSASIFSARPSVCSRFWCRQLSYARKLVTV